MSVTIKSKSLVRAVVWILPLEFIHNKSHCTDLKSRLIIISHQRFMLTKLFKIDSSKYGTWIDLIWHRSMGKLNVTVLMGNRKVDNKEIHLMRRSFQKFVF